jgi:hypothetical protein
MGPTIKGCTLFSQYISSFISNVAGMSFYPVEGNLQSTTHNIQEIVTLKNLVAVDDMRVKSLESRLAIPTKCEPKEWEQI